MAEHSESNAVHRDFSSLFDQSDAPASGMPSSGGLDGMGTRLSREVWRQRQAVHEARVAPWIEPRLARQSCHQRHPVEDFLFEYYPYRPAQLRRWHPGAGVILEAGEEFLNLTGYHRVQGGVAVGQVPEKRRAFVEWLAAMLESTDARPAFFACHGLHEWAMVYRSSRVRHESLPLRLAPQETDAVVESLAVCCSHYDAFRFFTADSKNLNRLQPVREEAREQPGCLHANMDLYKWSFKLSPWCPSDWVADAFELARQIRELDMRASPYDLSSLGLDPVKIETPEGRRDYEMHQTAFAARARPIRRRLLALCRALMSGFSQSQANGR